MRAAEKESTDRVPTSSGWTLAFSVGQALLPVRTGKSACPPRIWQLKDAVGRIHRAARAGHKFDVVVLPHPSGRSTWLNKPENAKLLRRSLDLIREHPAMRATVSQRTPRG